jgi:hypothetical protein
MTVVYTCPPLYPSLLYRFAFYALLSTIVAVGIRELGHVLCCCAVAREGTPQVDSSFLNPFFSGVQNFSTSFCNVLFRASAD